METRKISFVIPCYRSEHTLEGVVEELKQTVRKRPETEFEVILVDDCSPDNVWGTIEKLIRENDNIKGVQFTKNFGQHAALMAGFAQVEGDIVFCLDDDGQAPVDELYKLIDKLEEGYDAVYGGYPEIKQNLFRRFGTWVNGLMSISLIGWPKEVKSSSFFCCRRLIIEEMLKYDQPYPYLGGLMMRTTRNITWVEVHQRERLEGRSGYSFKKLLALWTNGFTAFSVKPLRIASVAGALSAMIGFLYGIFLIVRKLSHPTVMAGYSSIMVGLMVLGGIIMMMLGLIGEYIGRIYICINRSPQYVVRRILISEAAEDKGGELK